MVVKILFGEAILPKLTLEVKKSPLTFFSDKLAQKVNIAGLTTKSLLVFLNTGKCVIKYNERKSLATEI